MISNFIVTAIDGGLDLSPWHCDWDGRSVVVVITLGEDVRAGGAPIDGDPQEIISRRDASDIDPLAIERSVIDIRPTDGDALVVAVVLGRAGGRIHFHGVEQAEGLLVADHSSPIEDNRRPIQIEQFVEGIAFQVIMSVAGAVLEDRVIRGVSEIKVSGADVGRLNVKPHQLAFPRAIDAAFNDSAA